MRFISKLLATVIFGILAFVAASPLAAAVISPDSSPIVLLVVLLAMALLCFLAPTARRAWGRGSLVVGALMLALPFTVGALSGVTANELVSNAAAADQGAAAVGATLGAGLMVGASAFVGLFAGAIFIILGLVLVLGGRREVVIVQPPAAPES